MMNDCSTNRLRLLKTSAAILLVLVMLLSTVIWTPALVQVEASANLSHGILPTTVNSGNANHWQTQNLPHITNKTFQGTLTAAAAVIADTGITQSENNHTLTALNTSYDGSNEEEPEPESVWSLVWRDEFDGVNYNDKEYNPHPVSGLDLNNWRYQTGTGAGNPPAGEPNWFRTSGWGNNEMQNYQPEHSKIENGVLTITASPQAGKTIRGATNSGDTYWSSKIRTYQTYDILYGRIEASISIPFAEGFWPAFWMLPAQRTYPISGGNNGAWPQDGEIDIMEAKGAYGHYTSSALHRSTGTGTGSTNQYNWAPVALPKNKTIEDFNLYAVEWEPHELRWYLNDVLYQVITAAEWNTQWYQNNQHPATAPFDRPFNMILNLAVGGNFDNPTFPGTDGGPMTASMKVDYVRVYERNDLVDKVALKSVIDQFEGRDPSWYSEATWAAADTACTAAKAVYRSNAATQAQVDAARDTLFKAFQALRRISRPGSGLPADGDIITLRSVKNGKFVRVPETNFTNPNNTTMPTMAADVDAITADNAQYTTFEVEYDNDRMYLKAMNGHYVTIEDSNSNINVYRKVRPRMAAKSANGLNALAFELQKDGAVQIFRSLTDRNSSGTVRYIDWYIDVKNSGDLQAVECAANGTGSDFEWSRYVPPATRADLLIPKPVSVTASAGTFEITAATRIFVQTNAEAQGVGNYLAEKLRPATGYALQVVTSGTTGPQDIVLELISKDALLALIPGIATAFNPDNAAIEAYIINAGTSGLTVSAYDAEGLFRGIQTVRQLLPAEIETDSFTSGNQVVTGVSWLVSGVKITDFPRYEYRAIMMDPSRKWFPKEEILRQIDLISQYKMNVLRLHLTEDQGFRIALDGYPEITEFSANTKMMSQGTYNTPNVVGNQSRLAPGSISYGATPGQLSKADFMEILAYADERFVTVIPEIEFPSHNYSQQLALPLLSYNNGELPDAALTGSRAFWTDAVGQSITVDPTGGSIYSLLATKYTKAFIDDVFGQIADMLYGRHNIIHIGGDESNNALQTNQTYYNTVKYIIEYVQSLGKVTMQWAPASARNASAPHHWADIFQTWGSGNNGMNDAARSLAEGNKVVVSTVDYAYLDHFSSNQMPVGHSWGRSAGVSVERMYNWDLESRVPADYRNIGRVLGVEGPLWSETYGSRETLDILIYPRVLCLSEISWSPAENRTGTGDGTPWANFQPRLAAQGVRMTRQGITFMNESVTSGNGSPAVWPARTVNITTANNTHTTPHTTPVNTPRSGQIVFDNKTAQGDNVMIKKFSEPSQGTVTLDQSGNWVYTPNRGFIGKDSFTVGFMVEGYGVPMGPGSSSNKGTMQYNGLRNVHIEVTRPSGMTDVPVSVTLAANRPTNVRVILDPPVPGLLAANFQIDGGIAVRMAESFDNGSSYVLVTRPRNDNRDYTLSIANAGYTFNEVALITHRLNPRPVYFKGNSASFIIKPESKIVISYATNDAAVLDAASAFAAILRTSTGYDIPLINNTMPVVVVPGLRDISIGLIPKTEPLFGAFDYEEAGDTGYYLNIGIDATFLTAYTAKGIERGIQAMYQLLPDEIQSSTVVKGIDWVMTYAEIVDYAEPEIFTVTFMVDGEEYDKAEVREGGKVDKPDDPLPKAGYTFQGWLLDDEAFDFDTPITADITLTANWELIPITSIRIDSLSIMTVERYGVYPLNLILNEGAIPLTVEWTIADPLFGYVDERGTVTIFDRIGNVRLTATAPGGISHSITLRIAS